MTDDPIDERKIATELTQRAIDRIIATGERVLKEYWARYKNRDISAYADYLVRKGAQANAVRNFIYDSQCASLYDIYVPTMITTGNITGDQLVKSLCDPEDDLKKRPTKALAIVGKAGAGKSLFMKHVFFEIQRLDSKRLPILIEVRSFNRSTLADIEMRIFEDFSAIGTRISREQIVSGLRSGLFTILLDGMDELNGARKRHYESELIRFIDRFPLCPVLVSSRPMERMVSWNLDIRRIAPLDLPSAEDLISRLKFNEQIKLDFLYILRERLFKTHYELVSTPLLCTIMLITFSDSGRIANNRHEFYDDAFTALWSKHDNRKEGFERHRYTGLQKSEFLRLLAAFSMSSYCSGDYYMRRTQFGRHFNAATRLSGVVCKEGDFLRDMTTSTSLAVLDGPYIQFCHRSFQEYFSAVFVSDAEESVVGRLIEELSDRLDTDNVLPLVLSINDEKIERYWVMPKMQAISAYIEDAGEDLNRYATLTARKDGTPNGTAIAMQKLRILYELRPSTADLTAAYDAARHMGITVARLKKSSMLKDDIFAQDRQNFVILAAHLIEKYRHKSSALQDLLKRSAEPRGRL